MMSLMNRMTRLLPLLVLLSAAACDREDPTTIGGPLVDNSVVRTFEVTLDASEFLVRDTAFAAFDPPISTPVFVVAKDFDGVFDATTLARVRVDPYLGIPDSSGVVTVDSTPQLQRGRLVLRIDTSASTVNGPVQLRLYGVREAWDTATVTWRTRSGTGDAALPWLAPGGSRGVLIDSLTYTEGDSVSFSVDTLTLAQWRSAPASEHGIMLTTESRGTRLRFSTPILRIDFLTSIGDSTITQSSLPYATRFISDPTPPAASSNPRVGGMPNAYRTVLELRPDLAELTVPCPLSQSCRVRLKDASIAGADLLLQSVPSPSGFVPGLPVTVLGYTLLPTAQLPLVRSPIGGVSDPRAFTTFSPESFEEGTGTMKPLTITTFVRNLVAPIDTTTFNSRYLTLLQGGTPTIGYATFQTGPKLRLRLSVAQEIQLP
jgi:hypothetical protein